VNTNHTFEEFNSEFENNKIKTKIYENHTEVTDLLKAKGNQCFQESNFRSNGNIGSDLKSKTVVQNNSETENIVEYKLNTKYKNSFGIKTPDANSFIAIASVNAAGPNATEVSAVCRNKVVCSAIKMWVQNQHDGCPTEYTAIER